MIASLNSYNGNTALLLKYTFKLTGNVEAYGNIHSLINYNTEMPKNVGIFRQLFQNCTALTKIDNLILPGTQLQPFCYCGMFEGCTNITDGPKISATTWQTWGTGHVFVEYSSIKQMFAGCTNLSSIEVNFTTWPTTSDSTYNWISGVANTGQFICPAALPHDSSQYGTNKIPVGWTVIAK